jgi:hypothetical protein
MDPENPSASAVAVREGRILAVGEKDDLSFWIRNSPFGPCRVDPRFQDMVLMPGLVDAHTHLEIQALIYSGHFTAQIPWPKPEGGFYPVYPGKRDVLDRLKALDRRLPQGELLFAVAYDENKTGAFLSAQDLDAISARRPILVSNLVFHRFWANSHLLEKAGIGPGHIPQGVETDADGWPNGTLLEAAGLMSVLPQVPELVDITEKKLRRILPLFAAGGITTACEAALGAFGFQTAVERFQGLFAGPDAGLRVVGLPFAPALYQRLGSMEEVLAEIAACAPPPSDKFRLGVVKLYADGSIISRTAPIGWPGYWDGSPEGSWQFEPPLLQTMLAACHAAGFSTITHANSRAAVQAVLDGVREAQAGCFRPDMRHRIDHAYNMTPDQLRTAKDLGVAVQFFTPQIHYYGDSHLKLQGPDRAHRMLPTGAARRMGVSWGFHNDPPGTPQLPWTGIQATVERMTESGVVLGPGHRVGILDALRAITIEHAWQLGLESGLGSIEFGKRADFCVLGADPLETPQAALKDMPVWGTVFAGEPCPA